jgi:hypothetical protein
MKKKKKKNNEIEASDSIAMQHKRTPTLVGGWLLDFRRSGLGQVRRNPNDGLDFCLTSDVVV